MKGECKTCKAQVFIATSDGLCPSCRSLSKQINGRLKPVTNVADYPETVVVVDKPVTMAPFADLVKFTELPTVCPDCRKSFGVTNQPRRTLHWNAQVLILLGIIASVVFGVSILVAFGKILFALPKAAVILGACPFVLLISVPAILTAFLATLIRKVVPMKCRECGWRRQFVIAKHSGGTP